MTVSAQLGITGAAIESETTIARADSSSAMQSPVPSDQPWPSEVVVVRGESRTDLLRAIDSLLAQITRQPDLRLVDVGATLNRALLPGGARLTIVATNLADLAKRLTSSKEVLADPANDRLRDPSGAYFETNPLAARGDVALLFPGEGTQYLGMLADLPAHFPNVWQDLNLFDGYVGPDGDELRSVTRFFDCPKSVSPEQREHLERRLRQLDNAMFAVLAADWAIGNLLEALQLNVAAVAGHSAGELAALAAAGAIDISTQNASVVQGTRAIGDAEAHSIRAEATLLATSASRETLERMLDGIPGVITSGSEQNVFVAMDNCPHQSVVVGLPEPVEKLEAALKGDRVFCERLPFSRPYHTPLFDPFMGPLTEMFSTVEFLSPKRKIYSCTTGRPFPDDPEAIRQGAMAHWKSPVEFRHLIQNMHADGVRIFIEAGPRGVLSAFVQDILRGKEFIALPADLPKRSAVTQLNHLVAQLAVHHAELCFDLLYNRQVTQLDLNGSAVASAPSVPRPNVSSPLPVANAAAGLAPMPSASSAVIPTLPLAPSRSPVPAPASQSSLSGPACVMTRHLEVMERFLAAQQAATHDFLQARAQRQTAAQPNAPRRLSRAVPGSAFSPAARAPQRGALPATPQSAPAQAPVAAPSQIPVATEPPAIGGGEFPLAGLIVSHEPGVEMITRRRLDLREDRYAYDHAVGGLDISRLNPTQRGLPVMPMTFILETMAEAAARLVPGRVVIAVREIQLQRWLAFDEELIPTIEIVARRRPAVAAGDVVEVDVTVTNLGADGGAPSSRGTVTVGVVELAVNYPPAPRPPFVLENEREARVSIDTLYRGLFHGPMFRGVRSMDRYGDLQATATIEVLPRKGLFQSTDDPKFLIDPVTLDVGMHTGAGWHLEQEDQAGRILLPFELKRVEFYGPSPKPGTMLTGRTTVVESSPRHFNHRGELVYADGSLWSRMIDIKSWRFYLPFGQVNFNGPKDEYFISYVWPSVAPLEPDDDVEPAVCMRLDPSGDLTQSAMQDVAACITLSSREMREYRTRSFAAVEKSAWLFDRVAAKDAARVWWALRTGERQFMADQEIEIDPRGRMLLRMRDGSRPAGYPNVAVDGIVGSIFSLATSRPWAGIGVTRIDSVDVESAWNHLHVEEQAAVAKLAKADESSKSTQDAAGLRAQVARMISARKAVRNALGSAIIPDLDRLQIRDCDPNDQSVTITLDRGLLELLPEAQGQTFVVRTFIEGPAAVATFVGGPQ